MSRRRSASTRTFSGSRWSNWSRIATIPGPATSSSTSATATCSAFDFPGHDHPPFSETIGGVQHIAISVSDEQFAAAKRKLDEAGTEYLGPDRGVEESMYFRDPNGIGLELYREELGVFEGETLVT